MTSDPSLMLARRAAQAGQFPKAIHAYRLALKADPRNAETYLELAHILTISGNASDALSALVKAARIDPKYQAACTKHVSSMVSAGHKNQARKAIDASKPCGPLRKVLVATLKSTRSTGATDLETLAGAVRQKDVPRARAIGDAIIARDGDVPLALNLRGATEIQAGDPAAAEVFFRRGLEVSAGMVELSSNLGYALLLQAKFDAAIATLLDVIARAPNASDARINLASALYSSDRPDEALEQIEELSDAHRADATARRIQVQCLYKLGRTSAALESLRVLEQEEGDGFDLFLFRAKLIEETEGAHAAVAYLQTWAPRSIQAQMELAVLAAELGDLKSADQEYRSILNADPKQTNALYLLAMQDRLPPDDPVVQKLEALVGDETLAPNERADLHYGLAKSMLDGGRNQQAFSHLKAANAAQTPETEDRGRDLPKYLKSIRVAWDAERIRDYSQSGTEELAPIFVVGIQRSGSTLIEQILSAHSDVTGLGEQSLFYFGLRKSHEMSSNDFSKTISSLASELREASPRHREW